MHCCFLLSKLDYELVKNKKFDKLSFGLSEIIRALAKSDAISKVSLGAIHVQADRSNKSYNLMSIYKRFRLKIDSSAYQLSNFINWVDAKLNRYNLDQKKLNIEQIINFNKKLSGVYKFFQNRDGLYSYTYLDPKIEKYIPNFDFLLRGSGLKIEKGIILFSYSKLGCVSLHHGNNSINRGGPVGFWEVYYRQSSGITAQILRNELDGGKVVYQSRLRTLMNPLANNINIYKNTCPTILVAFNKILNLKQHHTDSSNLNYKINLYTGSILKMPRWYISVSLSLFHFLFTCLFQPIRLYMLIKSLFWNPYTKWGFAITNEIGTRLEKWLKVKVTNNAKNQDEWYADPFLANIGGVDYLIFEQFNWLRKKGVISYMQIFHNKKDKILTLSNERKQLLENKFHLSYPFTFERHGNTYMIPENASNGLHLYQLESDHNKNNKDLQAKEIKKLLSGRCIDPTLFRYDEVDYLFITEFDETKETLFLFMSDDIVNLPLYQHPNSPILVDHSLGRGAGRIFKNDEGKIIRPTQKCDRYYGEGIIFSEIKIDKKLFEIVKETERIIPTSSSAFRCLHHFDSRDGMFVLDYVKRTNTHPKPLFKEIRKT